LGGRIIGVVSTYDAITIVRLHRDARDHPQAVAELERGKGTTYNPKVVEAFLYLF
jgi:HD-GYP domain-containing protein (c-di-GMP phosphodiesterase class II)